MSDPGARIMPNATAMVAIQPEQPGDGDPIATLHHKAFGPGRFARAGYLLRNGTPHCRDLSLVARADDRLVASIRFAPVVLRRDQETIPALLLGPLAVQPECQGKGFGVALLKEGLARAAARGHGLVFLLGEQSYYARAGFLPARTVTIAIPHDPDRLLYLHLCTDYIGPPSGVLSSFRHCGALPPAVVKQKPRYNR